MADAVAVAEYLLYLAENEIEAEPITPLRLQKLLYYVQGWSWGYTAQPMFADSLKAWPHGPVVVRVYERYKGAEASPLRASGKRAWSSLTVRERELIEGVWEAHKQYSASALREKTHREPPWMEARRGLPSDSKRATSISNEVMKAFFFRQRQLLKNDPVHAERAARIEEARWQVARGGFVNIDDIR